MGLLIDGKWSPEPAATDTSGRFVRPKSQFRRWIRTDPDSDFHPQAGRYHLYVSYACPWAHRTLILRALKGLEGAVSVSVVDPFMGEQGWQFSDRPGCLPDTVNGAHYLSEVYAKANTHYTGRVTVPLLWDRQQETIVNNESREIMRMFDTVFSGLAANPVDFCPASLVEEIDATIDALYEPVNNGVYRAGFARTQEAHEEAIAELFEALDHWEQHLAKQRYLHGHHVTEADWCFFTTLLRFDPVYYTHFKCNLRRIVDYPNIWNYIKDLYQMPGVAATCNFEHIKQHYFRSHTSLNPRGIVPVGPLIDFREPHDRDRFG